MNEVKELIKIDEDIAVPKNYKVILLNNPITAYTAVVDVLCSVFNKQSSESEQIMWHCHNSGQALVMISTKEICEMKISEAEEFCMSKKASSIPGMEGRGMGYELLEFVVEEDK